MSARALHTRDTELRHRLRPFADNVLVLMDWLRDRRVERVSPGGIVLPMAPKPDHGEAVYATVISSGPGAYDEPIRHDEGMPGAKPRKLGSTKFVPLDLNDGDRVLIAHAIDGDPYMVDGLEYRIVRAEAVIGVVEDGEEAAE